MIIYRAKAEAAKQGIKAVTDRLEIAPGETIADLGCGRGAYAFAFAKLTQGMVYAADINTSYLRAISSTCAKQKINIKTVLAGKSDARLPGRCDIIFMRNVYHHIPRPEEYFLHLKTYLNPGGRLAVIDWKPGTGHKGHESSEAGIYTTLLRQGYIRLRCYDFLGVQSFNIFKNKSELES
jgi:cyclopropane fatty-acyl-phospholipid synthase-like methyltransferase